MTSLQRNHFKVKLFHRAMCFANALTHLPDKITPPPFRLIQMSSAYWQSRALHAAAELGIADALADEEQEIQQLADSLSLHQDHLYRLLRMLAALGVFEECGEQRFRNNRVSSHLRQDHPQSVRAMIRMHNSAEISGPWFDSLVPAMASGEVPFERHHGEELFHYMSKYPTFDTLFTEAMESVEALTGTDYLSDLDWSRFERIIDVGGSNGKKVMAILAQQPTLTALVFDRPSVTEGAAAYWRNKVAPQLYERLSFSGGDMQEAIPAARSDKDVYLFAAIFHGMGEEEALGVLRNLKTACRRHKPTILIADMVAEAQHINPMTASFDMQMLVNTRGRERTLAEWQGLLESGGFQLQEVVEVRTLIKVLVIRPRD